MCVCVFVSERQLADISVLSGYMGSLEELDLREGEYFALLNQPVNKGACRTKKHQNVCVLGCVWRDVGLGVGGAVSVFIQNSVLSHLT